jgi:HEAT repeat protein
MIRLLIPCLLLVAFLAADARGHGGVYRRPPDTPRIPTPGGPLPPITPPEKRVPPTTTPPSTPTIPGQTPGRVGPVRPPPPPVSDPVDWEVWWMYNRDRFMEVRATLSRRRTETEATGASGGTWRDDAIRALLAALEDNHPDVSTGAAIALGKSADPRAEGPLLAALKNRRADRTLRESAALALGMLGGEKARALLTDVLLDGRDRDRLRGFAALALGIHGSPASVPAFARVVRDPKAPRDARAAALIAAGMLGDEIMAPVLTDALKGRFSRLDLDERACAADGLGRLGDAAALPVLTKAATHKKIQLRRAAALAIGRLRPVPGQGHGGYSVLRHLAVSEKDRPTRAFATIGLARTGLPQAAVLLLDLANSARDASQKGFAILGAAVLARSTEDAALKERVASGLRSRLARGKLSQDLKGAAAAALGIIGDRASLPLLSKIVTGRGDPALRGHAAVALGMIGDREALPALRKALDRKGDPRLLREVALALGLLGDSESVRTLVELVREGKTEWVRGNAALGLGRIGGPVAAAAMTELLANSRASGPTRAMAAVALGHLLDEREMPVLAALVEDLDYLLPVPVIQEVLTIL